MRGFKYVLIAAFAFIILSAAPASHAQVSFGINIGPAPACPYGYYGYAPYRCAPYGYYGPEWFSNGVFIGAGPWHRERFYGHVDRHYDPRFGYHGPYPRRGEHWDNRDFHEFHGSHWSDPGGRYHNDAQHGRYEHDHDHDHR